VPLAALLALGAFAIASAPAMQRSLAPSAAPIALGASAIASALATQRLLASALAAAARHRTGAHGSPPSAAAGVAAAAMRSPTAAVSWRLGAA